MSDPSTWRTALDIYNERQKKEPRPVTISRLDTAEDHFWLKEIYEWPEPDIMDITRAIIRKHDEAVSVEICDHYQIDLHELREFIEEKRRHRRDGPN